MEPEKIEPSHRIQSGLNSDGSSTQDRGSLSALQPTPSPGQFDHGVMVTPTLSSNVKKSQTNRESRLSAPTGAKGIRRVAGLLKLNLYSR